MNLLDLILLGVGFTAMVGGYRLGFLTRTASWVGMGLGLVASARSLPWLFEQFEHESPASLLMLGGIVMLVGSFIGQAVGVLVGSRLRVNLPSAEWAIADHAFGALAAVVLLIPAGVAASIYLDMTAEPQAPGFGRTVHPAPPDQIIVHDQAFNLVTLENPYRSLERTDPEAFARHVAAGREVYYQNCFYCHGDLMQGRGPFAHGLNPIPTNFQDPGTIPMFQESFLFWRISKGGPGLPPEGGPWESAMPAWEKFLSEEEMWNVILFLYDFTETRPRARHETAMEELSARYPFFQRATIPAGTYKGLTEDYQGLDVGSMHLVAAEDAPEDLVYQVTRTLYENREKVVEKHPAGRAITPGNVVRDVGTPFHPGAERYYREIGIWP